MRPLYLVLGAIFGFVLSRSGAADYNYIQGMFLFERFQLYGIMGTAIVLTAPGLWLIQRRGRTALGAPRLERAIGVLYMPETERQSHYFHARLPEQFDFVLHFDETRALEPLERNALWEAGEVAETYPSGL